MLHLLVCEQLDKPNMPLLVPFPSHAHRHQSPFSSSHEPTILLCSVLFYFPSQSQTRFKPPSCRNKLQVHAPTEALQGLCASVHGQMQEALVHRLQQCHTRDLRACMVKASQLNRQLAVSRQGQLHRQLACSIKTTSVSALFWYMKTALWL